MDVVGAVANIIAIVTAVKDAVETGEGIGNSIGKVKDNRRKLLDLTTALSKSTDRLKMIIDKYIDSEALSGPEHLQSLLELERDLQFLLPRVKRIFDSSCCSKNSFSSFFGAWVKSGEIEAEIASLERKVNRCYQQFYVDAFAELANAIKINTMEQHVGFDRIESTLLKYIRDIRTDTTLVEEVVGVLHMNQVQKRIELENVSIVRKHICRLELVISENMTFSRTQGLKSSQSSELEYEYLSLKVEALTNALKEDCNRTWEQLFLKMDVNARFGTPGRLHWPYIGNVSLKNEEAIANIIRLLATVRDKNIHILDWLDGVSEVGLALLDLGLYNSALPIFKYACDTWKVLSSKHAHIFEAALASCLHNLSFVYKALGRYAEALDIIEEVVRIRLTIFIPTAYVYLPDLACSLMLRADIYRHLRNFEHALRSASEGVRIIRGLALDNPEGFNRELANCLLDQAALFHDVEDYESCILCIEEMLKLLCELAPLYADVFMYEIAAAYFWTAMANRGLNDLVMAEYSALRAVQIGRKLYRNQPRLEAPIFWQSLTILSEILFDVGDYEGALEVNGEAVDICSSLSQHDDDNKKTFAHTHRQRADILRKLGRHDDALESTIQAENIYRRLIESGSARYTYKQDLAVTLRVQSSCLRELHRYDDSLHLIKKAVEIGEDHPYDDICGEHLTSSLHEQSSVPAAMNDYADAYSSITKVIESRRTFIKLRSTSMNVALDDETLVRRAPSNHMSCR